MMMSILIAVCAGIVAWAFWSIVTYYAWYHRGYKQAKELPYYTVVRMIALTDRRHFKKESLSTRAFCRGFEAGAREREIV